MALAGELRRALAEGQLHVAYQPVVRLATGRPLGAEALLRWLHPERGDVPPAVTVPMAEDAGLIGEIGARVRQEALGRLGEWRAAGAVDDEFVLSLNMSAHQLADPGLPLLLTGDLRRYDVPARCVALELTESVLAQASAVTARVLFELRALGVRLLIDDFPTALTSLGQLRRSPVTGVKIDRSLVTGLGSGAADDEIVRALAAMCSALGLSVTAEGVETRVQRDALVAAGVTEGQGWLWGPAVPAADFARHWHLPSPALSPALSRAIR